MKNNDMTMFFRLIPPLPNHSSMTAGERLSSYVGDLTSALAMGGGISRVDGRIITLRRYKSKTQQEELDRLLASRNSLATSIEKVSKARCDLLQLLTTVTGMIRANEKTLDASVQRNPHKSLSIAKLRTSIGVKNFSTAISSKKLQIIVASAARQDGNPTRQG
jgi:hypothetical protein